MAITPLPPAPSRAVPSTFSTLADAFLGALPTFVSEANALQTDVNAKQAAAAVSAAAALASEADAEAAAALAALTVAAAKWVPGTTYAIGNVVWSPSNYLSYRRKTNGAGTTDPSSDTTNWAALLPFSGNTKALAGTDTASAMTPADVAAKVAVDVNLRAMSQGVAMTAAGSGSSGIAVGDDDDLDMGTGNFAPYFCGIIPDVTPATNIILAQKHDGTNGWILTLLTTGYLRTTINATTYDSTATLASVGVVDGASVKILSGITRETDSVAGSVQHYVNGLALGTSVAITAGAPTTVTNAVSIYVLGTSAVRTAGVANTFALFNRCPTAAEVLDLYRNGIDYADKWGSQTGLITGDNSTFASDTGWWNREEPATITIADGVCHFTSTNNGKALRKLSFLTSRKRYRITYTISGYSKGGIRVRMGGDTSGYGTLRQANGTYTEDIVCSVTNQSLEIMAVLETTADIDDITLYEIGATLALESEGIQPAPGQWLDSSSNKLHAMQPASGSSLVRSKKDFEYRWTNTWTASSAAQYVGGLNQAVLSADHFITDIITQATVTTDVENLTLGDGSTADKFVAAFAPSATRTKQTIAAQNDGTNLKLVYTPAAEATMTVETIIRGFIWEP